MQIEEAIPEPNVVDPLLDGIDCGSFLRNEQNALPDGDVARDQVGDGLAFPCARWPLNDQVLSLQGGVDRPLLTGVRIEHEELLLRGDEVGCVLPRVTDVLPEGVLALGISSECCNQRVLFKRFSCALKVRNHWQVGVFQVFDRMTIELLNFEVCRTLRSKELPELLFCGVLQLFEALVLDAYCHSALQVEDQDGVDLRFGVDKPELGIDEGSPFVLQFD